MSIFFLFLSFCPRMIPYLLFFCAWMFTVEYALKLVCMNQCYCVSLGRITTRIYYKFFNYFSFLCCLNSLFVLFRWLLTNLRFELDEFLGDFVIATLPEDSQDRPASLVFRDALEEWKPASAGTLKKTKLRVIRKMLVVRK